MKKLSLLFLIAVLVVAGCQPSQNAVNTAVAQTQAAIPTSTPAPTNTIAPTLSLSEIKFDPEIFRVEDLGLVGGGITNEIGNFYPLILMDGENQISRELLTLKNRNRIGWVSIILYESPDRCEKIFMLARKNMDKYKADIQKDNIFTYMSDKDYSFNGVLYYEGNLLISVQMVPDIDLDMIVFYAESLATRVNETLHP